MNLGLQTIMPILLYIYIVLIIFFTPPKKKAQTFSSIKAPVLGLPEGLGFRVIGFSSEATSALGSSSAGRMGD